MPPSLARVLPLLLGVGLAAALLVPEADRDTLAAQGLTNLLTPDGERPVLEALAAALGDERGTVAVRVLRDGADVTDDPAMRRAVRSALNVLGDGREPPLRVAPDGVPLTLALAEADATIALTAEVAGGAPIEVGPWHVPGRASVLPPLIAIVVALAWRKTILALFAGIWAGAALALAREGAGWLQAAVAGLWDVVSVWFVEQLVDTFRIEIIGFVIALVAMVGVMSRSGGVQGLIDLLLGFAKSVRSTLATTFGMGLMIFFDDYANCLLVGSTMRPLTDRLRVSREKLAYIVDSTAAPIAGISLLSTWIAFEVSTFSAHLPGAGITDSAYAIFLQTIPFRFYCLFTLLFVALNVVFGRDYGPMRGAEERARTTGQVVRPGGVPMVSDTMTRIEPKEGLPRRARDAALPILCVLACTLGAIFQAGGGVELLVGPDRDPGRLLTLKGVADVLFDGSGGAPIFIGATFGYLLALFLTGSNALRLGLGLGFGLALLLESSLPFALGQSETEGGVTVGPLSAVLAPHMKDALARYLAFGLVVAAPTLAVGLALRRGWRTPRPCLTAGDVVRASVSSTRALSFAVVILFEAWMIGAVCAELSTADYLVALLSGAVLPNVLPVVLFVAACVVAFSTGSSWSTMSILLPNVVALAATVGAEHWLGSTGMVVACIGAVLEGSIFGDHCSPISDTTVLSSVSSASDHIDHVRTQAPYALTTAAVAIGVGYLPTLAFEWWTFPIAFTTGGAVLVAALLLVGKPVPDAQPA